MDETPLTVEQLRQELASSIQPWRDQRTEVERAMAAKRQELEELEQVRRELNRVIRAAENPGGGKPGPKTRHIGPTSGPNWSPERFERFMADLRRNFASKTFTAAEVAETLGLHTTTGSKAMKTLHDTGRIRLDHMGGPRNTTKYYALLDSSDA